MVAESDNLAEIIIILGAILKCEIRRFEYNRSKKALWYFYRLFFTELDTNDLDVKDEWERKRKFRYKESLAFFLKLFSKIILAMKALKYL